MQETDTFPGKIHNFWINYLVTENLRKSVESVAKLLKQWRLKQIRQSTNKAIKYQQKKSIVNYLATLYGNDWKFWDFSKMENFPSALRRVNIITLTCQFVAEITVN